MLTDYHVHLRPDDDGTPSERYFTRANAERYREIAAERGIEAVDDLDAYCAFVRDETDLRLGIEADFVPGREDRMASLLEARDWDYVVGSIHFLRDEALDMRGRWDVWRSADPEEVWARYFDLLGEAARSGMFDVLAHPDLVKVWGRAAPVPDGDLRRFYDRAMDGIAESDVAIEVSTAGLRKPTGEIYPAAGLLEMCLEVGRPVALSSDAHVPDQLGHEYERAVDWLGGLGVGELAVFERRRRRMEPIG